MINRKEIVPAKTPFDLKLFYGFIALLLAGMAGILLLWKPPAANTTGEPDRPRHLIPFSLTNQAGRPTTQADLAGQIVVVSFVHSSCSLSCLQVNQRMAEVQRLTANTPEVRLLSITVDPRSDTPSALAAFGAKFGADSNRWSLLTGNKSAVYELIATSFLQREPLARDTPMPGGFLDTDRIAVVDQSGKVRRFFDGMRPETPTAIVNFIHKLWNESR